MTLLDLAPLLRWDAVQAPLVTHGRVLAGTSDAALDWCASSSPAVLAGVGCRIRASKLTPDPLPSVPKLTPKRVLSFPPPPNIPSPPGTKGAPVGCPSPRATRGWLGMSLSPAGAGDTQHTHTASPTATAPPTQLPRGPPPPRLSSGVPRPSRRSRRASERVAAGRRQTPTCQHAQGPPVAPHGRGRVFRQGAAGRTSDFLNRSAMGKLAF